MSGKIEVKYPTGVDLYFGTVKNGYGSFIGNSFNVINKPIIWNNSFDKTFEGDNGEFYIQSSHNLFRKNEDGTETIYFEDPSNNIHSSFFYKGYAYVVHGNNIIIKRSYTNSVWQTINHSITGLTIDVFVQRDGSIYFSNENGIYTFIDDVVTQINNTNMAYGWIYTTADNTIWVNANADGWYHLQGTELEPFDEKWQSRSQGAWMYQTKDGTVYVGEANGLYSLGTTPSGLHINQINTDFNLRDGYMYEADDGSLYIKTFTDGLKTYDIQNDKYIDVTSMHVNFIKEKKSYETKTITKPFIPFTNGINAGKKLKAITIGNEKLSLLETIKYSLGASLSLDNRFVNMKNLFVDNQDDNGAAENDTQTDGWHYHWIGRQMSWEDYKTDHWNKAIEIKDYKKYNKVVITFESVAQHNDWDHNSAYAGGAGAWFHWISSGNSDRRHDESFTSSRDGNTVRHDNMTITITDIQTKPHVVIANENHSTSFDGVHTKLEMYVAWGRQQSMFLMMGEGGLGTNSLAHNYSNQSGGDSKNYYGSVPSTSLIITPWPYMENVGGEQGTVGAWIKPTIEITY